MARCKLSLCVLEPKAKGNTRLEDFDTQEHELIYESLLTDKKMVQRDRLLPFINISDVEGSNYFNEYVYSPLHWTDCYFVNLGLIRYLEKHCKIVKWFSLGYSKKVPKHYIDWGYELLKDNAIGWPYIPIISDQGVVVDTPMNRVIKILQMKYTNY